MKMLKDRQLTNLMKKDNVSEKKQQEFSKNANLSSATTYSNFEQTGKISLLNFIKGFRAFGRISEIDNLLKTTIADKIDLTQTSQKEKKRVR